LEFRNVLKEKGCKSEVIIGEAADLIYACRTAEVGKVFHSGLKKRTKLATLPSTKVTDVINILEPYIPKYEAAANVLYTSFNASGAMLHPIPTLLNMNRIDSQQPFDYYMEGITRNIAKIIERADEERIQVVSKIGIPFKSLIDSIKSVYNLEGKDLFTVLQNNKAYIGVKSPQDYKHRFVNEDILCGLVPLSSFGSAFGIQTPIMDAFIRFASIINERDYFVEGRTVEKLGLKGRSMEEIYSIIL